MSDNMRPNDVPALKPNPGSVQDNMSVMPINSSDPNMPAATPDPSGETTDAAYGNEQSQRQKDAEEGRHAVWTSTDPVD